MIVVCDIDMTLADHTHRAHYVTGETKDWEGFLSVEEVIKDTPIPLAKECLRELIPKCYKFYLLTSRGERLRDATTMWLKKHMGISVKDNLLMRPTGVLSPGSVHKEDVLTSTVLPAKFSLPLLPIIVFDDDPYVLHALSKYAITIKAPDCWRLLYHEKPAEDELILSR